MRDGNVGALWGLGGLIVGAWVGSRFGFGRDGYVCGGGGYGYGPGYGHCAPGYGGYGGYGPGYYTGDRPCHEDKQDEKIACLQASIAAIGMAEKKDAYWEQKMECAQNQIIDGKIFAATCRKPDGDVFLSPRHLANAYRGESRVLDSHRVGCFDGFRDGFRDGRDGRDGCCGHRDGFRDGCCDGGNWY